MADHTIYLKVASSSPSELLLSNNGKKFTNGSSSEDESFTTHAKSKQTIKWKIADDSISSISSITPENQDLFSSDPTAPNWKGELKGGLKTGDEESYTIKYVVDGVTYPCDPKIKMVDR